VDELVVGFLCGLVSSIPMLGPVVLLLFAAGAGRELVVGRALALGAAASEGAHVAAAVFGIGPVLLAEPVVAIGARVVSGVVLMALAWVAWRGRAGEPTRGRVLPTRGAAAFGLGVALVLPNPGFLVVWVAIVGWLPTAGLAARPGGAFVGGAVVGIGLWFAVVMWASARWGAAVITRHGQVVRRALAIALFGFGAWAVVGALAL